jgi:hypothetical protein
MAADYKRVSFSKWIVREDLDGPAVIALRLEIIEVKQRWLVQSWDGTLKIYYIELLGASAGTLSRCFRLHLQSLAPTNPHWARVVGYDPFSLCIIHKEGLCPRSGDINDDDDDGLSFVYKRFVQCQPAMIPD